MSHSHTRTLARTSTAGAIGGSQAHSATARPVAPPAPAGSPPLHLRGVLLPQAEQVDLWTADGRICLDPVPDAAELGSGYWVAPGLVDAHCHVGLGVEHGVLASPEEAERQAITDRDAGTLLIRDAGSPTDTHWMDARPDLPRIIRAGRHIARPRRYIRDLAVEIDPEQLVAEVERQARAGDGWVKLVGDWIDRAQGDLAPLWPQDVAARAIQRAHALGARVTAHCFAEQSAAELVAAGIDGIEHGTGLSDEVIDEMARRQVALVPTMVNLENFPSIAAAGEAKYPTYAAHMRALHARRLDVLRHAREAGVPIYAGTDAGSTLPHGLIGREIELLCQIGDAGFALGAASWRAREWLGRPGLTEGAPADLVVYDADPIAHPQVVNHPRFVVLGGVIRGGDFPSGEFLAE